jgi:hypothetical protein
MSVDPLRCIEALAGTGMRWWWYDANSGCSSVSSLSCVMIDSKCIFLPKSSPSRSHEGRMVSQRLPRASLRTVCVRSISTRPRCFGEVSRWGSTARGCVLVLAVFAGLPEPFTTSSSTIRAPGTAPPNVPFQFSPHVYNQPNSRPIAIDR